MSDSTPPVSHTYELFRPVEVFVVSPPKRRYWLHGLLLLATIFTMLVMGARLQYNFQHGLPSFSLAEDGLGLFPVTWAFSNTANLLSGIPFACTLILILLAHEMGHFVYCMRYGVNATLPFFIPFPSLIGTLGAFIRIKSPIRSRAALFDIGIAGPIAGFIASLFVLVIALPMSRPLPIIGSEGRGYGLPLVFNLVYAVLHKLGMGIAGSSSLNGVSLHPMAIAAWVGMFATSLNLLPGGQLDGGHILYSVFPRAHKRATLASILLLIPLGAFWLGWWVWAILLGASGLRHPQVAPWPHIDGQRKLLAVMALGLLVLTFVPIPFREGGALFWLRN